MEAANARIQKVLDCFVDWALRNPGDRKYEKPCFDPAAVLEAHKTRVRKPSKEREGQGTNLELLVDRPRQHWKPIVPDHGTQHVLVDWLPEVGCFLAYAQRYGESGSYVLIRPTDGEIIFLHDSLSLSPDGELLATAGTNPYVEDTGVELKVFAVRELLEASPKSMLPFGEVPGTAMTFPELSGLLWKDARTVEVRYRSGDVEHRKAMRVDTGQVFPVLRKGDRVGTLLPAVTIRSAPSGKAAPLAIVPFATTFAVRQLRGDWIEVEYDQGRSGHVFKDLGFTLPEDMRHSAFCNRQFGRDVVTELLQMGNDVAAQERYWKTLTSDAAAAKLTRDALEVWAYCRPSELPAEYRKWLHTLAFQGLPGLPPAYAQTPRRFLQSSPAFEGTAAE